MSQAESIHDGHVSFHAPRGSDRTSACKILDLARPVRNLVHERESFSDFPNGEGTNEEDSRGYNWWRCAWHECCHQRRCPYRLFKEVSSSGFQERVGRLDYKYVYPVDASIRRRHSTVRWNNSAYIKMPGVREERRNRESCGNSRIESY